MIGSEQIALMKTGAYLINNSRGSVVDIDALNQALRNGQLAGAALDVFPREPRSMNEAFSSPLQGLENVILTPHIGGSTQEAQDSIGKEVAERLVDYLDNGSTIGAVNMPKLQLSRVNNSARLIHVHKNQPKIIVWIKELFDQFNLGIERIELQTHRDVNYLALDISSHFEIPNEIMKQINSWPETIRSRLLEYA